MDNTYKERTSYKAENSMQKASWKYLNIHSEFLKYFTKLIEAVDSKDVAYAKRELDNTALFLQKNEDEIQKVFDVSAFIVRYNAIIDKIN